ncbi:MAG: hypothetical protein AAFX06_22760 [Planctomycetota bacterium]
MDFTSESSDEVIRLDLNSGPVALGATFAQTEVLNRTYSIQASFIVTEASDAVRAQFIDLASLEVSTAGGLDEITVAAAPGSGVNDFELTTGDSDDIVGLYGASTMTQVGLGAGDDEVLIALTGTPANLTVDGGSEDDFFNLIDVPDGAVTNLNGESGDDEFLISGSKLESGTTTSVEGGNPTDTSVSPGDSLIFNAGLFTDISPNDGPSEGSVGIDAPGLGQVDFVDIESVIATNEAPRFVITNPTPTITEGDDLVFSIELPDVGENNGVVPSWSVNGNQVNQTGTTLNLSWAQLTGVGVNDGFRDDYPIIVQGTNSFGVTTSEIIYLTVLNEIPEIDLDAPDS